MVTYSLILLMNIYDVALTKSSHDKNFLGFHVKG
jgi:hypothetical protein